MTADRDDTPAATLLKAATDAMVDPQALVEAVRDDDGRIVDFVYREVNPAACDYLQRPGAELVGATLTETLPDLVKSGLLARYAQCLVTGEPLTVEDFPYFSQRYHTVRWYDLRAARAGADWLSMVWRDVTDRHRSNQLVAESEEHFRLLAENSSDVIAQVRDGVITWVSPSVGAAFGAPPSHWIGMTAADLVAPEDQADAAASRRRLAADGREIARVRVLGADGVRHWTEFHASTFFDSEGHPDGYVVSFRVVDAEVAAEQERDAARAEQARADAGFRLLFEHAIVPTALTDTESHFLAVNQAMCDMLGYDEATLLTKRWQDVTPAEYRQQGLTAISDLASGRADSSRFTKQYLRADGQRIWGEVMISRIPAPSGGVANFIAQIIDITEQVELREKQAEADARFRRLMETSSVGTCLAAPEGKFDVVNAALCEFFGYDDAELRTKTWQDLTAPAFLEADLKNTEDLVAGRIDTYRTTKQFIHADGHLIWGDLSASCLRKPDGELERFVAQIVDVTDEVQARQQLAASELRNRELADRMQAELHSAADYVRSILPDNLHGPVDISSYYLPALELGGDGFHYRWLDDDHLKVYLIDVSGHGIRPALLSMSVHNLIRSGSLPTTTLLQPEQVLDSLNDLFQMDEQGGAYFTIWYGVYEMSTRTMRYASAGHPPALALNRDGDTVTATLLSTPGIPIGMFPDGTYTSGRYHVLDGGQILICSDGAYELPIPEGAEKVLCHNEFVDLCATAAMRPDWSLDALVDRLKALTPDGHFEDDCALVLLRFDADRRA